MAYMVISSKDKLKGFHGQQCEGKWKGDAFPLAWVQGCRSLFHYNFQMTN